LDEIQCADCAKVTFKPAHKRMTDEAAPSLLITDASCRATIFMIVAAFLARSLTHSIELCRDIWHSWRFGVAVSILGVFTNPKLLYVEPG